MSKTPAPQTDDTSAAVKQPQRWKLRVILRGGTVQEEIEGTEDVVQKRIAYFIRNGVPLKHRRADQTQLVQPPSLIEQFQYTKIL